MIEEISCPSSGVIGPSGSSRAICSHFVIVAQFVFGKMEPIRCVASQLLVCRLLVGEGASAFVQGTISGLMDQENICQTHF